MINKNNKDFYFVCIKFFENDTNIVDKLNNFFIFFESKNIKNDKNYFNFLETHNELSLLKYYDFVDFNDVNNINFNTYWENHIENYIDFEVYNNLSFFYFVNNIDRRYIVPGMRVKHLWFQCDNCEGLNYKSYIREEFFVCEICGIHMKINSQERINLLLDQNSWKPFEKDKNLFIVDPIDFDLNFEKENKLPDEVILVLKDVIKELNLDKEAIKELGFESYDREILLRLGYNDLFRESIESEKLSKNELIENKLDNKNNTNININTNTKNESDDNESDDNESDDNESDKESKEFEVYPGPEFGVYTSSEFEDDSIYNSNFDTYIDNLIYHVRTTGFIEAVQTGIGKLNGVLIAIGFMDFSFIGGSMGSVVGEKLTRLIEYATEKSLPIIIICASGGARMQEGILSLMQMAKISSALYYYKLKKNSLYISILTSPTTGGVTASFGMLGDIIIAEPDAYIAFAGKRVIEKVLNIEVPEGLQEAEYLYEKGSCDLLVPRNLFKETIMEIFKFHGIY
uniref:Acetyl-coenzyme A carboxylase carboxyl transferase subunit beta n=2 Tax=Hydnora visseri TaxID=1329980 RepID=A0A0X9M926_HYDVS|nr:acetyl-CoA carboxylase beta subunit [Hydnora visseri]ALZ49981.1 acetyl-CoA carboxylase beta subunit [Hydnora visseri]